MKKKILLMIIMILLFLGLKAKVRTLPDMINPDSITVSGNELILTQGEKVYIYNIKNLKLIKSFGQAGEGPGEFKVTSYMERGLVIDLQPQEMLISSVGKLTIYDRNGNYIKEIKASHNHFGNRFLALGQDYIGTGTTFDDNVYYIALNLYGQELKKKSEVFRWESPYQRGKGTSVFREPIVFRTFKDKIFTVGGVEFKINKFDKNGKKIQTIQHEYKKNKVPEELKNSIVKYYKTDPTTKNIYHAMKPILFPDYFPAIRTFLIANDKIYVVTFKEKNNLNEIIVLDISGKFIKKVFLQLNKLDFLNLYPFTIQNDILYQINDNEETEACELHSQKI